MPVRRLLPIAVVASLALIPCGFAQLPPVPQRPTNLNPLPAPPNPPGNRVNNQDRQFVQQAMLDGYLEVNMGRLAGREAQAAAVKRYAGWMVRDNRAADDQLQALAQRKGMQPPRGLNPQQSTQLNRLSALPGSQFDRSYLTAMVQDHDNAIRDFRREVASGSDPDLRRFARQTLMTLTRYAEYAHQLSSGQSIASSAAPSPRR